MKAHVATHGLFHRHAPEEHTLEWRQARVDLKSPEAGAPQVITTQSRCCNAVRFGNGTYAANQESHNRHNGEPVGASVGGINAKGGPAYGILIESCTIRGQSHHQAAFAISAKSLA